jgi:hypothetical protein
MKHLKHTIKICAFSIALTCCLDEWRLVDAELDPDAELAAPAEKCHGGWLQRRRRTARYRPRGRVGHALEMATAGRFGR